MYAYHILLAVHAHSDIDIQICFFHIEEAMRLLKTHGIV